MHWTTNPIVCSFAPDFFSYSEATVSSDDISTRKRDHIRICAEDEVEAIHKTNLLDDIEFFHNSLPELSVDDIDLSTTFLGRSLRAPLLITGMTGGAAQAARINRDLAIIAQEFGLAFGVGSQRAMSDDPGLTETYQVREYAPDIALLGNIGAVQAASLSTEQAQALVEGIDADALCIHLNPGQELIQPEGDRDFRGCLDGIVRLVDELDCPVIVKETGCGLSPSVLDRLHQAGVQWVDTSGAGGTTWIGVESRRAPGDAADLGRLFWDWGVPTAASINYSVHRGFSVIGSGGLRTGYDAACALALGAEMAGMALPWLRAAHDDGVDGARQFAGACIAALRTTLALTGSKTIAELQKAPKMIGPRLQRWIAADPRPRG